MPDNVYEITAHDGQEFTRTGKRAALMVLWELETRNIKSLTVNGIVTEIPDDVWRRASDPK